MKFVSLKRTILQELKKTEDGKKLLELIKDTNLAKEQKVKMFQQWQETQTKTDKNRHLSQNYNGKI